MLKTISHNRLIAFTFAKDIMKSDLIPMSSSFKNLLMYKNAELISKLFFSAI